MNSQTVFDTRLFESLAKSKISESLAIVICKKAIERKRTSPEYWRDKTGKQIVDELGVSEAEAEQLATALALNRPKQRDPTDVPKNKQIKTI